MRQKQTFEWASAMFALPTIADQYLGTASYRNQAQIVKNEKRPERLGCPLENHLLFSQMVCVQSLPAQTGVEPLLPI